VPFLDTNGPRLHVQMMGDGTPIIMLHGLITGSLATWYYTAAPTLARQHKVLLYDLRGHGRSERCLEGYDSNTQTQDLASIIEAYTEGPVALVGHSFGALIALKYALNNPSRVSRLALIELPLPPSRTGDFTAFIQQSDTEMVASLPAALQQLFGATKRGRRLKRFLASVQFLGTQSSLVADLANETDIPDSRLAALSIPTLGVFGSESSCRQTGQRLNKLLPAFRLVECAGGHYLPLEAPQVVTSAMESFFNG